MGVTARGLLGLMAPGLIVVSGQAAVAAEAKGDIIQRWNSVTLPKAPELVTAEIESAHSALLILDMYPGSCVATMRPTCPATVPAIKRLLEHARASKMLIIYSAGPVAMNGPTLPVPELAPLPGEPTVRGAADKWIGSELERILADHHITTVIVTGTSADGAVMYTASGAALRGIMAVVPVDGMSSADPFAELYTAWHLKNTSATVSKKIALTRSDLITLK